MIVIGLIDFEDVLLAGLATDGGLYVPQTWPALGPTTATTYVERAVEVMLPFVSPDIDEITLTHLCSEAYGAFRHPAVVPLVQIGDRQWVQELFHGPTLAFKDVALQLVGRLFERALQHGHDADEPLAAENLTESGEDLLEVRTSLGDPGEFLGTLAVGYSLEPVEQQVREIASRAALVALVLVVAVMLAVALGLTSTAFQMIERLPNVVLEREVQARWTNNLTTDGTPAGTFQPGGGDPTQGGLEEISMKLSGPKTPCGSTRTGTGSPRLRTAIAETATPLRSSPAAASSSTTHACTRSRHAGLLDTHLGDMQISQF